MLTPRAPRAAWLPVAPPVLLAALPFVYLVWMAATLSIDVPFWDAWELVPRLQHLADGSFTLNDLWQQHNEHRHFFPILWMLILARLSDWNGHLEIATNVNGDRPAPGDASQLLGALPGGSFAALATSGFGRSLGESIDSIDRQGIPGELGPGELKAAMKAAGIDLDKITASISDVGVFAQGNTESNLTGAVVLTTTDAREAANTVSNIGLLLRAGGTRGVTAISGKATGFTVRHTDLGDKPLIVAAQGNRIAISYGPAASAQALTAEGGATLASNPEYQEAKAALGGDPISAFVDGPAALAFAANAIAGTDKAEDFEAAKPYLEKVTFVAIGAGSSGDLATARMIVGIAD